MEKWAREYKSWYDFVVGTYRNRFEELLQVLDQVAFRNMDERLEFYLKRQSRQGDLRIIQISHQQIANDLNSTREVISRLLKKMEQRGLLKLNRNNIELGEELLKM
jgi:CRP/FNR family transcriptional regulator